jgi:hypothetical protein
MLDVECLIRNEAGEGIRESFGKVALLLGGSGQVRDSTLAQLGWE